MKHSGAQWPLIFFVASALCVSGDRGTIRVLPGADDTPSQQTSDTADKGKEGCSVKDLVQLQLNTALGRIRTSIVAAEQRLVSLLDTKLAAMQAQRAQELQTSALSLSNKVDTKVTALESRLTTLLDSKLVLLETRVLRSREEQEKNSSEDHTMAMLVRKVATLEAFFKNASFVHRYHQSDSSKITSCCNDKISTLENKMNQELQNQKLESTNRYATKAMLTQKVLNETRKEARSFMKSSLTLFKEQLKAEFESYIHDHAVSQEQYKRQKANYTQVVTNLLSKLQSSINQLTNRVSEVDSVMETLQQNITTKLQLLEQSLKSSMKEEMKNLSSAHDQTVEQLDLYIEESKQKYERTKQKMGKYENDTSLQIQAYVQELKERRDADVRRTLRQHNDSFSHLMSSFGAILQRLNQERNESMESMRYSILYSRARQMEDVQKILGNLTEAIEMMQGEAREKGEEYSAAVKQLRRWLNQTLELLSERINTSDATQAERINQLEQELNCEYPTNRGPYSLTCLRRFWVEAGCTSRGSNYPKSLTVWWNSQTLTRVKEDMALYYTYAAQGNSRYKALCGI